MSTPTQENLKLSQEFKEKGNLSFSQKNYSEAISWYAEALRMNPYDSIFYSNKARCHFNIKQYYEAIQDAKSAINLDRENIKAHIIYIQAEANLSKLVSFDDRFNLASWHCKTAIRIANSQGNKEYSKVLNEIRKKLKVLKWCKDLEHHNNSVYELLHYYAPLVADSHLQNLFDKYVLPKISPEIRESVTCPITFELYAEPIICSSGHTYEKEAFEAYLLKGSYTDPVSRKNIIHSSILPNKCIKEAVDYFTKTEIPWSLISYKAVDSTEINF